MKQLSGNLSASHKITVVTPAYGSGSGKFEENSVAVVKTGGGRLAYFPKAFFSLVSSKKFDVYHAHGAPAGFLAKIVSWLKGGKVILHIHGYRTKKASGFFKYHLQNLIIKLGYDRIISVDGESALKIRQLGIPPEKIAVIPVGVDTNLFSPSKKAKKDTKIFLFVGRLEKVKGLDTLIEAVRLLDVKGSKAEVWIVGSGSLEEKLKAQGKLLKNMRFLGAVPHEKLAEIYNQADFFILPSISEGSPLTILEALSCGLPIIVSDIPSLSQIIKESKAGITFPVGNAERLSEAMVSISSSKDLDVFRKNARDFAEKNYSWRKISAEVEKVYEGATNVG